MSYLRKCRQGQNKNSGTKSLLNTKNKTIFLNRLKEKVRHVNWNK